MAETNASQEHAPSRTSRSPIQLRDVTSETGISFVHTDGSTGERYIMETVTAGLALFDYDRDGDIDIYFLNGAPPPQPRTDPPPRNALYRNDGAWKFTDVTEEAGVGDQGFGLGVAIGDFDNDGAQDIYVNNFGPNVLYRNNGDGTFVDVTAKAGVADGNKMGAGACFLDMDADGDLDLYVSSYVRFSYDAHVTRSLRGFPEYPSPLEHAAEPDALFRNNGDGTFSDVSLESGVGQLSGRGMGVVCADYDRDGDTDIFVLNDMMGNYFFENDGSGNFNEVGLLTGTAYNVYGEELGSMGIDCGDFDNDGWLDFFMTSYQQEEPVLYRNLGNGSFEDVTFQTGAGEGALSHVNWGTGFVDFDNDGDRDIFVACGHLQDQVDFYDDTTSYHARNLILMNTGKGTFLDVSDESGDGMSVKLSSRGACFDDLDNDGDMDVVVLNSRREPTILRNESSSDNHWIQIDLQGTKTNLDGVGAQVTVFSGELVQVDEVHSGRGYQSHWGSRLHFGLGQHDHIDRIEVRWIGGGVDTRENVLVDQILTIEEGGRD